MHSSERRSVGRKKESRNNENVGRGKGHTAGQFRGRCRVCGEEGHIARECSKRRPSTNPGGEVEGDAEEGEEEPEEENDREKTAIPPPSGGYGATYAGGKRSLQSDRADPVAKPVKKRRTRQRRQDQERQVQVFLDGQPEELQARRRLHILAQGRTRRRA